MQCATGQCLSSARSLVAVCARLGGDAGHDGFRQQFSATETLCNGCRVELRAERSQDREGAAVVRSSLGALYRRFFSVSREFSDNATEYFVDIDFINHVSLVSVAHNAGQPTIVGCGRMSSSSRSSRSPVRDRRRVSAPTRRRPIVILTKRSTGFVDGSAAVAARSSGMTP